MTHHDALTALTHHDALAALNHHDALAALKHHEALAALGTATRWHKSTRSDAQNGCLEITTEVSGWIGVRDTKLGPRSPVLAFSTAQWTALVAAATDDTTAKDDTTA